MRRRSALRQLLDRARGPLGPPADPDFGSPGGPFAELGAVLAETNGFFVFNAGIQVFRVGPEGLGYDVATWNDTRTWRYSYNGLIEDDTFIFGQDLYGWQFGISSRFTVVAINPETAAIDDEWRSVEDWASWLLADPDAHGRHNDATAWQDHFGALDVTDRLIHRQLIVLGGGNQVDNLVVKDGAECMRVRGPIAATIKNLPDGAQLRFEVE